jgi:hypothetical protein
MDGGVVTAVIEGQPVSIMPVRHQRHSGPSISRKLHVVCARCNNGWMSRLQKATKKFLLPMIDGTPTTLDRQQQLILSRWADQTAVVTEFSSPDNLVSSPEDRQRIMDDEDPSPALRTQVWIGANGGQLAEATSKARSAKILPNPKGIRGGMRTHLAVAGHFAFYVVGATTDFYDGYLPTDLAKHDGGKLIQIWPTTQESVEWPPQMKLSAKEYDLLGNSLTADSQAGKIPGAVSSTALAPGPVVPFPLGPVYPADWPGKAGFTGPPKQ